jgi:hypothetical protein
MLRKFAMAFMGSLMLTIAPHAAARNVITVYYVPFRIETYVPVTQGTISCQAWEVWTVSNEAHVSRLRNLLKPGDQARFEGKRVRVKISDSGEDTYVDAEGVALRGKASFRMDKTGLESFARSLGADEHRPNEHRPCKIP